MCSYVVISTRRCGLRLRGIVFLPAIFAEACACALNSGGEKLKNTDVVVELDASRCRTMIRHHGDIHIDNAVVVANPRRYLSFSCQKLGRLAHFSVLGQRSVRALIASAEGVLQLVGGCR